MRVAATGAGAAGSLSAEADGASGRATASAVEAVFSAVAGFDAEACFSAFARGLGRGAFAGVAASVFESGALAAMTAVSVAGGVVSA